MDPTRLPQVPYGHRFGDGVRQEPSIQRRTFMALVSGGLLAAPLAAEAQQARRMPKIGVLTLNSPAVLPGEEFFWERMRELGWVEGQNVAVERRGAGGNNDHLPIIVAELVKLKVDVMTIWGGGVARRARDADRTVPMCVRAGDLQAEGLVANLAKPEGNVTGVHTIQADLAGKRLEILKEVVPGLTRVGVLIADRTRTRSSIIRNAEDAARTMGLQLYVPEVNRTPDDLTQAFSTLTKNGVRGLSIVNSRVAASWWPHRLWTTGIRDQSSMG
jgi:putative ABC transport system substrate-binding protein